MIVSGAGAVGDDLWSRDRNGFGFRDLDGDLFVDLRARTSAAFQADEGFERRGS
jgi:hypothetical protein